MSAQPGRPLRVAVADDQTVVRDGLVVLLGLLPDVEVVAAAGDGEQAVALVAEQQPDVVLTRNATERSWWPTRTATASWSESPPRGWNLLTPPPG